MIRFSILLAASLLFACDSTPNVYSVGFVGDILLDRGVRERVDRTGYEAFYSAFEGQLPQLDYLVGNLECPVTDIQAPVIKQYIFRGEPEHLIWLKKLGFTHFTMANNHSYDQGRSGLVDTHARLSEHGLISLGYGIGRTAACAPVWVGGKGRGLAIFSAVTLPLENWVPLDNKPMPCQMRAEEMAELIRTFRMKEPDAPIIVQLHWGIEHRTEPSPDQRVGARMLIDAGADLVVGHHPHVIQQMELYRGKPIYYSLGNFVFDQQAEINRKSLLLKVEVRKDGIRHEAIEYLIEKMRPRRVGISG